MDGKEYYRKWCNRFKSCMRPPFVGCTLYFADRIPKEGAVILAAKHSSFMDIPILGASTDRMLHFMAKESLFRQPILGKWMRKVEAFEVKRGTADTTAIRTACQFLKEGEALAVYPEGTRRNSRFQIGPLNEGVAFIAQRAQVPIVPVGIFYQWGGWPLLRVVVVFGEPICVTEVLCDNRQGLITNLQCKMEFVLGQAIGNMPKN